jgi:hypothetical protein
VFGPTPDPMEILYSQSYIDSENSKGLASVDRAIPPTRGCNHWLVTRNSSIQLAHGKGLIHGYMGQAHMTKVREIVDKGSAHETFPHGACHMTKSPKKGVVPIVYENGRFLTLY